MLMNWNNIGVSSRDSLSKKGDRPVNGHRKAVEIVYFTYEGKTYRMKKPVKYARNGGLGSKPHLT